jgi:hypothetical protein
LGVSPERGVAESKGVRGDEIPPSDTSRFTTGAPQRSGGVHGRFESDRALHSPVPHGATSSRLRAVSSRAARRRVGTRTSRSCADVRGRDVRTSQPRHKDVSISRHNIRRGTAPFSRSRVGTGRSRPNRTSVHVLETGSDVDRVCPFTEAPRRHGAPGPSTSPRDLAQRNASSDAAGSWQRRTQRMAGDTAGSSPSADSANADSSVVRAVRTR